jgi:VIT1/CCC1 family predicted Fe2+/Mn2+ transporter
VTAEKKRMVGIISAGSIAFLAIVSWIWGASAYASSIKFLTQETRRIECDLKADIKQAVSDAADDHEDVEKEMTKLEDRMDKKFKSLHSHLFRIEKKIDDKH